MSKAKNKASLQKNFITFKRQAQTLFLSTVTDEGKPNASYSPFVSDDNGYLYIFVSGLASHTQDLLESSEVSVLLTEDEEKSRQIYARQRISYQCSVEIIANEHEKYPLILDKMENHFGNIIELLRNLPDFILFQLTPFQGQYVKGFGKAYKLVGEGLLDLEHIQPNKKSKNNGLVED